jgi:hypothetical protein
VANQLSGGFLRDEATGALAVTSLTTGAVFSGGFLRAPTGELVVIFA